MVYSIAIGDKKMKFKLKIVITGLLLILMFCSCSLNNTENERFFYVENRGAKMPVWIEGNLASDTVIIKLHGGPGGSGYYSHYNPGYQELEEDYTIVYWDQRGAGSSLGNPETDTFAVDIMVEDLDIIIDIVQAKFNFNSLFLLGHSWGGYLGINYLLEPGNQSRISGWIELDGSHNQKKGNMLAREYVINYATDKLNSGNKDDDWQGILDWCNENPVITIDNFVPFVFRLGDCEGYYPKDSSFFGNASYFNTPLNNFNNLMGKLHSCTTIDFYQTNMEPEMVNITIPTLILWGQHDHLFDVQMAQDAYDAMGTPASQKSIVIFSESGHSPPQLEPFKFADSISSFIEIYR